MPISTRQTTLLAAEDWTKVYQSFKDADFQAYDFETIRKAMIDYLRLYYPEDFNDYIESSEYIALIDLIATLGQSLAYRDDLNTRENFIDTAERRESILRLATLVSYSPKRSTPASGILKIQEIVTTEFLTDSNGIDLSNTRVLFNDGNNSNWQEQFNIILNASLEESQKIGQPANSNVIAGIDTDEYTLNASDGTLPVFSFTNNVDGVQQDFEVTSATTEDKEYIYEAPPKVDQDYNILFRNDNLGFSSVNTGFFMRFTQGTLASVDFEINETIPNRIVAINVSNINQTDVWLYKLNDQTDAEEDLWSQVPSVAGQNIAYNNISAVDRDIYQITSNQDDSVNVVFGDGVFATMPKGKFRFYYRESNGLGYKITPAEMTQVVVPITYVSRTGRTEVLTFTGALQYTVANAASRETDEQIKEKAPQQYYTQNRMINGEDYNVFPYTQFNNIIKSKAVNRSSSGISRFLDVLDTTGKYSSTNIFADDGILYREDLLQSFNFQFTLATDILSMIEESILPIVQGKEMQHFYFDQFTRFPAPGDDMTWVKVTTSTNQSTGYFVDSVDTVLQVGTIVSNDAKYITNGSIIKFRAPAGFMFDGANTIQPLPTDRALQNDERTEMFTGVVLVSGDGSAQGIGVLPNGVGAITLADVVPSLAEIDEIIPAFNTSFTNALTQSIIAKMLAYSDFGLRYDLDTQDYAIIAAEDLDSAGEFSLTYAGDISGTNLDASWIIKFETDGTTYDITYRGLSYIFESVLQTRFYFDEDLKVFDPVTGQTINDYIDILKVNSAPDSSEAVGHDTIVFIYENITDVDGYNNNKKIKITFSDLDSDAVPDNPDFFDKLIDPATNPTTKYVFFEKSTDADNFEILVPLEFGTVVTTFATRADINANISNYDDGQIFYATTEETFHILVVTTTTRTLTDSDAYVAKVGRQDLFFQYRHNAPNNRRIDPSPNNIIDLFVLTRQYEEDYSNWVSDVTGTVDEPSQPTAEELRIEFNSLDDFKAISDTLIYNSAKFKPLFGTEADTALQAVFKVVKNENVNISDSKVKSNLIAAINRYFEINNWDFGETFFFTELSTYLHTELVPEVASVIIVSKDGTNQFGSLFQINSEPNEILKSAATVDDVKIITAITAAQIGTST